MGRHLTEAELDIVHTLKFQGLMLLDIHGRLTRARSVKGEPGPSLRAVRRALKGTTYKRAKVEARGRKRGEDVDGYKARLRRTALTLPAAVVRKMLASMKPRACEVVERKGGHIHRD